MQLAEDTLGELLERAGAGSSTSGLWRRVDKVET